MTSLVGSRLDEFIVRVQREFVRPRHLEPMLVELERCEERGGRLILNVPPRHGKSATLLLWLIRYLLRHPTRTVAYVTYNARQAIAKSREARAYAMRAGLQVPSDASALSHWYTPQGGGIIFTSIGGAELVGQGVDLLVIDDPHQSRVEVESKVERDKVWEFYRGVAVDRLEPGGALITTHTRWHADDLTGRMLAQEPEVWTHVNLRAIDDEGNALWPEVWPADNDTFVYQQKYSPYEWYSKYQGEPRPRGGAIFQGAALYDRLPKVLRSVGIGVDVGLTGQDDWSVAVVVGLGDDDRFYVLDVRRARMQPREFGRVLASLKMRWPTARYRWYGTAHERIIAQMMREQGAPVVCEVTTKQKVVRAAPVAGAWNAGEVLVPRTGNALLSDPTGDDLPPPAWVGELVSELADFKGLPGDTDDQVDGLAAAYDLVDQMSSVHVPRAYPSKFGRRPVGGGGKRSDADWNRAPRDEPAKPKLFVWE